MRKILLTIEDPRFDEYQNLDSEEVLYIVAEMIREKVYLENLSEDAIKIELIS